MHLIDLEDAMQSRSELADAQNGSFVAADPYQQDRKPGFEFGSDERRAEDDDQRRRRRSDRQDVPQAPLAERIREREAS